MKLCVATVVSPDDYLWFVPVFAYTAKRAMDCEVRVYVKGKMDKRVRGIFEDYHLVEEFFESAPFRSSTCNSLRQLLPDSDLAGFDYLLSTDVDFIFLPQEKDRVGYYKHIMEKAGTPYAGARGPLKGFRRAPNKKMWTDQYTRIAAGCFMVYLPEWLKATKEARELYRDFIKKGSCDLHEPYKSCSYREYDEVMLYRICKMSKLPTPRKKDRFVDGRLADPRYRDIHLGDFKFGRYKKMPKMQRILTQGNVKKFLQLEKEPEWRRIVKRVCRNKKMNLLFKRLRSHIKKR